MTNEIMYQEQLVFGLDIGTRSVVGTVGYKENEKKFKVVAQAVRMHETRAMLDGQIHDISKVAATIKEIKTELETMINRELTSVCIAAAGRVLKTVTVRSDYEFEEETKIEDEHIHSLELLGVEQAYEILKQNKEDDLKLYCVGYTVIHYYLNDYAMGNLEGHKGSKISAEVLATFLPDEVIDGLYTAVERAGLQVANLTLEPIAAIEVAIPVNYRLLNIALVDVGAGTSDICITKDGSIIGYGMIPFAGDEFTEEIAKRYLVEFKVAEEIKMGCFHKKMITYKDILGISHRVSVDEVLAGLEETMKRITKNVADKIKELNGGKSVSAVFIVGGGGKLPGFSASLAEFLELPKERVAIRGEEVLSEVEFVQKGIKKDSLLVTPIGICLNFYEQNNNFIFTVVNGKNVKLYDNNKLTIIDAAMQVGFPNHSLFPKRGKELNFTMNGEQRLLRGEAGEAAIVHLNGKSVPITHKIMQNDVIEIIPSTAGCDAVCSISELPEYKSKGIICFEINGKRIECPKLIMVNENIVSEFYEIQNGDIIEILNYYTVEQILTFMDVACQDEILVNRQQAQLQDKVYENFTVTFEIAAEHPKEHEALHKATAEIKEEINAEATEINENQIPKDKIGAEENVVQQEENLKVREISVLVNGDNVILSEKENYILVDVLDFYPFDLSVAKGSKLITTVNGIPSQFTQPIKENDVIELYWVS